MRRGKGAWRLSELHQQDLEERARKGGDAWRCARANMNRVAPEPFIVKGTSTLYDADGKAKLQWVKTRD